MCPFRVKACERRPSFEAVLWRRFTVLGEVITEGRFPGLGALGGIQESSSSGIRGSGEAVGGGESVWGGGSAQWASLWPPLI